MKISVIIPVYNVEKYLERCLDSVLSQTHKDLEIILVNDGSTDSSPSICNKYKEKDYRVKVVNKENGGLSSARNAGLEIMTGEIVGFVDSDDFIAPDYYKTLCKLITENNVDIVSSEYILYKEGDSVNEGSGNITSKLYETDEVEKLVLKDNLLYYVWSKVYKAALIKDVRFDEKTEIGEDQYFNWIAYRNAKKIMTINYQGYYYYQNENSLSGGMLNAKHKHDLAIRQQIFEYYTNKDKTLYKYAKAHLMRGYLGFYLKGKLYGLANEELEKDITNYCKIIKKNKWFFLSSPCIDLKRKAVVFAILINEKLAVRFMKKVFFKGENNG